VPAPASAQDESKHASGPGSTDFVDRHAAAAFQLGTQDQPFRGVSIDGLSINEWLQSPVGPSVVYRDSAVCVERLRDPSGRWRPGTLTVRAVAPVPAHHRLGRYDGTVLSPAQFRSAYVDEVPTYVMSVRNGSFFIDASEPVGATWWTRELLCVAARQPPNAVFMETDGEVYLHALRDIPAGEQIVVR
jgi:hypothetical protein